MHSVINEAPRGAGREGKDVRLCKPRATVRVLGSWVYTASMIPTEIQFVLYNFFSTPFPPLRSAG